MKLGILILQFNSIQYTEQLCKQIPEAIIIDNGSSKQANVPNEVIRLDKNYGFTIGWVKGIQAVWDRFDAFWLMNNDISIERSSIDRVKDVLDNDIDIFTPSYNGWALEFHKKEITGLRNVGCIEFCAPIITKKAFEGKAKGI
jgi:GT2 family glycosyltransferase